MTKHWNDEMMELEAKVQERDNLTISQRVAMEGWDLRWEISRLQTLLKLRDAEITALKYDKATLIAELNSVRGRKA